jgi:pseudaminic acid cytidylyltransferase
MKLAVIPARGGSKRIPRKNIRLFRGRPMIAHAIEAARDAGLFDHVVVSTDDEEIADTALAHGATVPFRRPPALADDQTTTVPVIGHAVQALRALGWAPEAVCCIYPCVPFLRGSDLRAAHALFTTSRAPFVYPVVGFHASPQRAMRRLPSGQMQFLQPQHELTRTQDLEPCFHDAGQFYWGTAEAWASNLRMHSNGVGWAFEADRAVDIDTPEDWHRAELLAQVLDALPSTNFSSETHA